jgi:hypothetical protein
MIRKTLSTVSDQALRIRKQLETQRLQVQLRAQQQARPPAPTRIVPQKMQDGFERVRPLHADGPAQAHAPTADDTQAPQANGGKDPTHDDVPHHRTAGDARQAGQDIVSRHTDRFGWRWPLWKHEVDTAAVTHELEDFLAEPSHSQAERAVVLDGALDAMNAGDRKKVAVELVNGIPAEELDAIGRSGIESLLSALGTGDDTAAQRAVLEAELARRGPVQERIVNGVRIVGDEVSVEAMDAAEEQVRQLTEGNPEVAGAMQGATVVVVPADEQGTDQELVFEAMGIHGQRTADGRLWDGVGGGALGKFMYVGERDLVRSDGSPGGQYTLNHEFTHGVHRAFLETLPVDDPRLTALLDPGTQVTDVTGDGRITASDVFKMAWEQRRDSGRLSDDYSGVNEAEWLAQAGSSFAGEPGRAWPVDAQWLYDNDRALYDLMKFIYGPSPQDVDTGAGSGGGRAMVM